MVRAINSERAAQHHNPVPNAATLRGLLVTSSILGKRLDSDESVSYTHLTLPTN